jgi:hypothetical protein
LVEAVVEGHRLVGVAIAGVPIVIESRGCLVGIAIVEGSSHLLRGVRDGLINIIFS